MFCFEVSYFAQAEPLRNNIFQDREPVMDRRTLRRIQKRRAISR
jgi:hypothetical protein